MSVIVFAWGLHRKLASRFILGPISFLAITRMLFSFVSELNSKGVKNFPKYFVLYWATIRQVTSYWGNMTSRKEYYASRDASKVYLFYCFPRWRVSLPFLSAFPPWYYTLGLKPLLKVFKKKSKKDWTFHPTYSSCYSPPSLWILQWNRLLKPINRGFNWL
jgi:hypothetical protein